MICPDKSSPFYRCSVLPVLNSAGLYAKKLSPQCIEHRMVLEQLCKMAGCYSEQKSGYEFDLMSMLYQVWKSLRQMMGSDIDINAAASDTRIKDILIFLQQNYFRSLTLDEIAASVSLSRSECCRYSTGSAHDCSV